VEEINNMGRRTKEAAREYARKYRLAVKAGVITPIPASERRRANTIECDVCKAMFYRPVANRLQENHGKYCSRKCMAQSFTGRTSCRKHEHNETPCAQCGKVLHRPDWVKKQRTNAFCNRSCFALWKAANWCGESNPCWRGGTVLYYGPNWIRQSREARKRDGRQCQFCGINEKSLYRSLDVHHIKPFRFFTANDYKSANKLANLISLCGCCHKFLEYFSKDGTVTDWNTLKNLALATSKGRLRASASAL
jgi:5-methylcytosine-specific restriction endonuclease McrA